MLASNSSSTAAPARCKAARVAISTASKSSLPDLRRPAKITASSDSTSCATSR